MILDDTKTITSSQLLKVMGAVRQICYSNGPSIPKYAQADLRRELRSCGFSLPVVKKMEEEFYKKC